MNSADIREAFLTFFESKGHTRVTSSSLVPDNDPTLLFTNAGMVQFKDVFLGADKRDYTRACSSQRCVRAGGKHNDLENVGYTARHHTFFEMLGNFSFGDYFKQDAIHYAWEFLTSKEWLNIPADKLTVTVYAEDDEAFDIWHKEVGVPADKIIRIGDNKGAKYASDNFWAMGDTGPCGPCTEIFYDHGEHIWGGPPGSAEEDGDRFIEIWNNVFMQFNRTPDGEMHALPAPSVDTGMGLERIAAVLQHVNSNYEIDLFQNLLKAVAEVTGATDLEDKSLRVIADHIRSCAFLIVDGVLPGNEGRGYVLRRIIRRAIRHGNKLGADGLFFHKLVPALVNEMGQAYPELTEAQQRVIEVLEQEEQQFAKTLEHGMSLIEEELKDLQGEVIPGEVVFKLYDTYGFPVDLTNDIARERGLIIDEAGYEVCMAEQQSRSRDAGKFSVDYSHTLNLEGETSFTGYQHLTGESSVVALLKDGEEVESLSEGEEGVVILSETPFYAESGGQAGDSGYLLSQHSKFEVQDTTKINKCFAHHGVVAFGSIKKGESLECTVDAAIRNATALNHSATHLLHAALREVLGEHVQQKGSLVTAEKLRFDFANPEAVTKEQLKAVEQIVNQQVRANTAVETVVTDMESARKKGAMMLFGEKYGDEVRVLSMGTDHYSVELCGGTHVNRTGDIGLIRIIAESGIASGVRRIEAITGEAALNYIDDLERTLDQAASSIKASRENLGDKVQQLSATNKQLEKQLADLKLKLASGGGNDLASQAEDVNGVKVLAARIDGADSQALRATMDKLKDKLGEAVILLAAAEGDKVSITAGVTKGLTNTYKAGDLMKVSAAIVGGKGGGRPDMAQGGGTDTSKIDEMLAAVKDWVANQ